MINEIPIINAPVLVTENVHLQKLCAQWELLEIIALDTEFIRVDTFFPRIGLIQVGDGESNYLLDPLSLSEWGSFISLLRNTAVIKVLHSCSEDLVVFKEFFSQLPEPLFDTQRAAAFLGYGYSISYQNLVKEMLGIEISKDQTRSDWLQRPLSEDQRNYAGLDVAYLPAIARHMQQALSQVQRLSWAQDEFTQMLQTATPDDGEKIWQEYYQGIGGAWRLDTHQLAALQRLCVWRESEARSRNKPRNWIARDNELLAIASAMPSDANALTALTELPRPLVFRDGPQVLALVCSVDDGPQPNPDLVEQPLDTTMRKILKTCQGIVKELAESLDIAPELLARKKQLMPLILTAQGNVGFVWPADLDGWRRPLLEARLREALRA